MVLTFDSENDRQSHPVVRHIPQRIWEEVFLNQLDDFELALMTASSTNAHALLESESFRLLDEAAKQRCLLALLLSQPNRSELFNELNQQPTFHELLHKLLLNAIQNKHINIIERLIERLPQSVLLVLIDRNKSTVLLAAIQSDDSNAINRLLEAAPHEIMKRIEANDYQIFLDASERGDLNFINHFMSYVPGAHKAIRAGDWRAFRNAALHGHLAVLNRLIELAPAEMQLT